MNSALGHSTASEPGPVSAAWMPEPSPEGMHGTGVAVGVGAGVDVGGLGVAVGSGTGALVGSTVGASVGIGAEVGSAVGGGGAGIGDAVGEGTPLSSGVRDGRLSEAGEPMPATTFGPSVARAIIGACASGVITDVGVGDVSWITTIGVGVGAAASTTTGDGSVAGVEVSTMDVAIFWIEGGTSRPHPRITITKMSASHVHRVRITSTNRQTSTLSRSDGPPLGGSRSQSSLHSLGRRSFASVSL